MKIKEIKAKSILSRSRVYGYALNPYVGCRHACVYCYAMLKLPAAFPRGIFDM